MIRVVILVLLLLPSVALAQRKLVKPKQPKVVIVESAKPKVGIIQPQYHYQYQRFQQEQQRMFWRYQLQMQRQLFEQQLFSQRRMFWYGY